MTRAMIYDLVVFYRDKREPKHYHKPSIERTFSFSTKELRQEFRDRLTQSGLELFDEQRYVFTDLPDPDVVFPERAYAVS